MFYLSRKKKNSTCTYQRQIINSPILSSVKPKRHRFFQKPFYSFPIAFCNNQLVPSSPIVSQTLNETVPDLPCIYSLHRAGVQVCAHYLGPLGPHTERNLCGCKPRHQGEINFLLVLFVTVRGITIHKSQ